MSALPPSSSRSAPALSQAEFEPIGAARFDASSNSQTVMIAEAGRVSRTNIVRFDIDPRIDDRTAEVELRFFGQSCYETPPLYCSRIPGGAVVDAKGSVRTADDRIPIESRQLLTKLVDDGQDIESTAARIPEVPIAREVDGDVAVVFSMMSPKKLKNYFSWLTEGLSRAALAIQAGVSDNTRFLIPGPIEELHIDTMALLGIARDRLLPWDGKPTRFRTVYLPSLTWSETDGVGSASVEQISQLGPPGPEKKLTGEKREEPATPRRRFYVSRRNVSRHSAETEEEIERRVEGLGFEPLVAEDLGIEERIELMREADMIVGLHGTGLANCLWMPTDATVCEIGIAGLENGHEFAFWNLAAARGQRYALHLAMDPPDPELVEQMLMEATLMRDGEPVVPKRKKLSAGERKRQALERGEGDWFGGLPPKKRKKTG